MLTLTLHGWGGQDTKLAMSRLRLGHYEKITAEFKEAFWPADAPFIGCCPPQPSTMSRSSPVSLFSSGSCGVPFSSPASTLIPPSDSVSKPLRSDLAAAAAQPLDAGHPPGTLVSESHVRALGMTAGATSAAAAVAAAPLAAELAADSSPPAVPIFLENYLWSKGAPVLTAAVVGERAGLVAAAAAEAAAVASAGATGEGDGAGSEGWRASHAREMYHRLVKPALVDAFGNGEELPEPVSVSVTRRVRTGWTRGVFTACRKPLGCLSMRR